MGILAYGAIALAIILSLGGLYGAIHHSGVKEGEATITERWEKQNAKNREIVLADRKRQEAVRDKQTLDYMRRLTDGKKRTGELMASLEAHIRASGLPASCRVNSLLLNDINSALSGKSVSPGSVLGKPSATPPSR